MSNEMPGRGGQIRLTIAAVLTGLCAVWPCQTQAASVSASQAAAAVSGWLTADSDPLDASLAKTIGEVTLYPGVGVSNAFYVVSMKPAGFVIVAADDLAGSVVAFSSKGAFDPSPDSAFFRMLQADLPRRVANAKLALSQAQAASGKGSGGELKSAVTYPTDYAICKSSGGALKSAVTYPTDYAICRVRVPPLLTSHWGTGAVGDPTPIFNYYTPSNAAAGQGAICLAQIIRHHQQEPPGGIGWSNYLARVNEEPAWIFTRGGNGLGGPYDWDSMVDDPQNASSLTIKQRQAIGALCADVSVAVTHADFDVRHRTSDSAWDVTNALKNVYGFASGGIYGLYNGLDPLWQGDEPTNPPALQGFGMINANLDAGFPVLLSLMPADPSRSYLVPVDCDGYGYSRTSTGDVWMFHHINMARGAGSEDIWYTLPAVQGGIGFTNIFGVIYNIMPTNKGEIISGRVVDQDGFSMPGILMTVTNNGGTYTNTTVTGPKGIYAFTVPSSDHYTVPWCRRSAHPKPRCDRSPFLWGRPGMA